MTVLQQTGFLSAHDCGRTDAVSRRGRSVLVAVDFVVTSVTTVQNIHVHTALYGICSSHYARRQEAW